MSVCVVSVHFYTLSTLYLCVSVSRSCSLFILIFLSLLRYAKALSLAFVHEIDCRRKLSLPYLLSLPLACYSFQSSLSLFVALTLTFFVLCFSLSLNKMEFISNQMMFITGEDCLKYNSQGLFEMSETVSTVYQVNRSTLSVT